VRRAHLDRLGRLSWRPLSCLREHLRAGRCESDERAALVHDEPTALDRQLHAGAVLRGTCFVLRQERPIDLLDVDPAVLYGSMALAISSSLRAATAGSASGLAAAYFMGSPYPSRARRTAGTFPDLVDFRTENYWLSVITSGGGRHQIVWLSPECPIHARHRRKISG
jgi:hypothetical protein